MTALDDLPPDQRAVLQLVLQRGRSYDEIAQLLSIDRSAVRQRALNAFDALTPATVLAGPEQGLVTDYLLAQLPEKVAEQVYSFLEASDADRAWAEAIVEVVRPLVSRPLPEIPVGGAGGIETADDWSAGGLERDSDPHAPGAALPVEIEDEPPHAAHAAQTATPAGSLVPPVASDPWEAPGAAVESQRERDEARPSSRRGGAILLTIVAVMIAAAIIIAVAIAGNGGGKGHASTTGQSSGSQVSTTNTTPTTGTGTTSTTGTGTTSTPTTTSNRILAQLNLHSPNGAKQTVGIVDVARVKGVLGMVIYAQGVPANGAHNAYAVWLYNSPTSHYFVGFVPNLVGKDGKLVTEGKLPPDALAYHQLLITLETQSHPTGPGEVVLSGPFREHA